MMYEFGSYRLDPAKRLLWRGGEAVPLKPKPFDTLILLVESPGRLLAKEELIEKLWPDTAVEENNLTQCIYALRRVLGEGPDDHRFIVTIPGRGYRFVADVRRLPGETTTPGDRNGLPSAMASQRLATDGQSPPPPVAKARDVAGEHLSQAADQPQPAALEIPRPAPRRLTGPAFVVALVAVGFAAALWLFRPEPRLPVSGAITSLAVLPFKQVEPAGAPADLGLTLADAVIARLTTLQVVTIRPTAAVLPFAGADPDPVRAAYDLDVDAVVDGAYRLQNGVLRLTLRLVTRKTGDQIWFESFERVWDPTLEDTLAEHATGELVRALKSLKIGTPSVPVVAPRAAGLGVRPAVPFTILVADDQAFGGGGGIIQIDPATGAQTALASGGVFVNPSSITVEPSGDLFVADADALGGTGAVIRLRFDAHTRRWLQTVVSKGGALKDPSVVAFDRAGALLVVDQGGYYTNRGRIVKVDPDTGVQTVVSEGQYFHQPQGITIDRDDRYIVADLVAMMGGAAR